jgi:hypothetical protein
VNARRIGIPSTRWAPGVVRVLMALFVVAGLIGLPSVARAQFPGCTGQANICTDGQIEVSFSGSNDCAWKATIDWGDGIVDNLQPKNGDVFRHIYASEGFYTVNITGSGSSTDPDTTCTFHPTTFTVEVVVVITPALPPIAKKDVASVPENGSVTSDLLVNDNRGLCCEAPNRLPFNLNVTITKAPRHGTASLEKPPGHVYEPEDPALFTYTPGADFCGIDSFTYSIKPPDAGPNDPPLQSSARAIVFVCPETLTDDLAKQVRNVKLTKKERRALFQKLGQAQNAFEKLKLNNAISNLKDFIKLVEKHVSKGGKKRKLLASTRSLIKDAKGR